MKPNSLLPVICLLLSFSNANLSLADAKRENGGPITEISVERTHCLGMCPADEVVLRSDGTATYIGKSNVKEIGVFTGHISRFNFKMLSDYFTSQNFFEMDDTLPGGPDTSFTFINVVRDGRVKTLRCFWEPNSTTKHWGLAMAIRGVAADINWQKHKAGVRGALMAKTTTASNNTNQPDKTLLANKLISIQRYATGHPILSVTTDANGHFEIGLPPGSYFFTLGVPSLQNGRWSDSNSQMLFVKPNSFTEATIDYKP